MFLEQAMCRFENAHVSSSRETISSWERWVEVSNHKGAYEG